MLSGDASFAIIVVDVNFLKRVNDTYGHEKGNEYLITNAKAITEVFGKENVYRVGGDEFTVVLRNQSFSQAEGMVKAFKDIRTNAVTQENEWELVRAAIGLAVYSPETDSDVETVFKRADTAMYEDKVAMKVQRRE
ncbi:MAG: GGDEF domain-containing protein [Lachnospiraceae bacterium]|nr:GGDEF domain-containing protein [Lachnospiraceae bacterium]